MQAPDPPSDARRTQFYQYNNPVTARLVDLGKFAIKVNSCFFFYLSIDDFYELFAKKLFSDWFLSKTFTQKSIVCKAS